MHTRPHQYTTNYQFQYSLNHSLPIPCIAIPSQTSPNGSQHAIHFNHISYFDSLGLYIHNRKTNTTVAFIVFFSSPLFFLLPLPHLISALLHIFSILPPFPTGQPRGRHVPPTLSLLPAAGNSIYPVLAQHNGKKKKKKKSYVQTSSWHSNLRHYHPTGMGRIVWTCRIEYRYRCEYLRLDSSSSCTITCNRHKGEQLRHEIELERKRPFLKGVCVCVCMDMCVRVCVCGVREVPLAG